MGTLPFVDVVPRKEPFSMFALAGGGSDAQNRLSIISYDPGI